MKIQADASRLDFVCELTLKEKWKPLMNIGKGNKKLIRYALHNIKATRIAKKKLD